MYKKMSMTLFAIFFSTPESVWKMQSFLYQGPKLFVLLLSQILVHLGFEFWSIFFLPSVYQRTPTPNHPF